MFKREHESFKEYAQRWRDLVAQVAPPMMEREMITKIVDTLPVFYYEKMVGYMPSSFADLVITGKRTAVGLRRGKFYYPALMNRKPGQMKRTRRREEPMLPFLHGQISHPLHNINTQPILVLLITHHTIIQAG